MTDAPERIWATSDNRNGSWTCEEMPAKWGAKTTAYTRDDLPPSPEVVKELVEAAKFMVAGYKADDDRTVQGFYALEAALAKLEAMK